MKENFYSFIKTGEKTHHFLFLKREKGKGVRTKKAFYYFHFLADEYKRNYDGVISINKAKNDYQIFKQLQRIHKALLIRFHIPFIEENIHDQQANT